MLSTASALIEATEQAVMGDEQMEMAAFIVHARNELSQDEFARAMFMYSCAIASTAVDRATRILLSETQMKELLSSIGELEQMKDEVLNGK